MGAGTPLRGARALNVRRKDKHHNTKRGKHMGAWSHTPFGNDTANDWAYGLEEVDDLSVIESAIDAVLQNGEEYLEAPEAEEAVAAIEVIAKLLGKGTQFDTYTEKVDEWVKRVGKIPSPELLQKAREAISRILSADSELAELWEDSEEWRISMQNLNSAVCA